MEKQEEYKIKLKKYLKSKNYNMAFEYSKKLGIQYKISKQWLEAGDTFMQAGDLCIEKLNNRTDCKEMYKESALAYRNGLFWSQSQNILKNLAQIMMADNQFAVAGKVWKEVSEIYERNMDKKSAITMYTKSYECYMRIDNSQIMASSVRIKIAGLLSQEEKYEEAIKIYEEIVEQHFDNNSMMFLVSDYYFSSLLCSSVIAMQKNDFQFVRDKLAKYIDNCPRFDGSKEAKLIANIIDSLEKQNEKEFVGHLYNYNKIYTLNPQATTILYKIKMNCFGNTKNNESDMVDLS